MKIKKQQLEVARRNMDYHTKKFGYEQSNIKFKQGFIEKLAEAGIQPSSYDIIMYVYRKKIK